MQFPLTVTVCVALGLFLGSAAGAQQIYRWTDADGNVHFGNQPPQGAQGLEAKDRKKTGFEVECESAVKKRCQEGTDKRYSRYQPSDLYRECVQAGMEACQRIKPHVETKPTVGRQRYISASTLSFDPTSGDSLTCQMRCPSNCQGVVEIRGSEVLKKGENLGKKDYAVEVKPKKAGSAFCAVTTQNEGVVLVLNVLRNGAVAQSTEAQPSSRADLGAEALLIHRRPHVAQARRRSRCAASRL